MPDSWTVYLDDRRRRAHREDAIAKGGQVHMEPMQVAENGSFTIIGDPGGAGIGAWQADQVTGFEIWNEPGAPRWFELRDAAVRRRRRLLPRRVQVEHAHVQRHAGVPLHDASRRRRTTSRGSRSIARGNAPALDDLLRRRGHGRRPRAGRRARRQGHAARRGHAVRPAGAGRRPTGTPFKLMASAG